MLFLGITENALCYQLKRYAVVVRPCFACSLHALSPVHTSDNVAETGDIVAETGNIVFLATMSPFLATLSLVWTGLYVADGRGKIRVFIL